MQSLFGIFILKVCILNKYLLLHSHFASVYWQHGRRCVHIIVSCFNVFLLMLSCTLFIPMCLILNGIKLKLAFNYFLKKTFL